jgi:uncharacterized protein (DUF1501 family)
MIDLTRRQFLKGASATAVIAGTNVLAFAPGPAHAAATGGKVLVLLNLFGGNDALNTVIPLDNVSAPQRTLYEGLRPDLAIPTSTLSGFELGSDPLLGNGLALHPSCSGLKTLYDEGKLALVNGVGLVNSSMSHFDAQDVWYSGNPALPTGTGWLGRHMDVAWGGGTPRAVSFGSGVSPSLTSTASASLGMQSLSRFVLPDHHDWQFRDLDSRREAWNRIFAEARTGPTAGAITESGANLVAKEELFSQIPTRGWGSNNEDAGWGLGAGLREVASVLGWDKANPGDATGLCIFHLGRGGFDTHSRQGTTDTENWGHPYLWNDVSQSLYNFQRDLETLEVSDRVVTMVYTEFGRRAYQNDSGNNAGTDHGRGGTAVLMGDGVVGGLHGGVPALDDLDDHGNLKVNVDFRSVYAAIIDDWLGGDHSLVLPGGPFTPVPVIA